ncbi:hypothetical protein H112_05546 [Trichophyton rubrum D6]|uniref:Uncharacterized protein n=3 Tax=Trichophyton TaxID=5550 RepID=A0A080WM03_TRIRC|nr:uncharacterized protein TERG_11977 [Trichophyton rubrum CBS 118892]EZF16900.1 hypothetical protein H100_05563 [Trichophyton rubrum MR850]EZF40499.1 hypothetical protein H102_05531 [Trichophyton rubrum CBS 100081]EZF51184.1 hypothetical protein H103_05554 [Trichophyton rubrum CBS 288.86]EZF61723.1 hypothetical protein H104_05545 [Trichophyton rubrum CBS 289.86]EZF72201.1 hypothetical protein H105_05572 [Trichophyton soudanense CBS 452.61]EZF82859.1 hypothetical protein H110_05553 [Trichophy
MPAVIGLPAAKSPAVFKRSTGSRGKRKPPQAAGMTSKAPGETSAASGWAWWAAGQRPERTAGAAGQALSVGAGAYTDATVSQGVLTAEPLCYGYRLDRYWLLAVFAAGWFLVWCLDRVFHAMTEYYESL